MIDVAVTATGTVGADEQDQARQRIAGLDRCVRDPVLGARVVLRCEPNPRIERPALAKAEVNVNGHMLRCHVAASTMPQAINELVTDIERSLQSFVGRRARLTQRTRESVPGEWHHAAWSPPRPRHFPRPAEERLVVRRKTFALGAVDPLQAVVEMLDLDHDFYLFRDAETDADAVVYHRDDGRLGVIYPAGLPLPEIADEALIRETSRIREPIGLEVAIAEMNVLSHRFMFFVNADTSRGNVIYMRYDGNYGVIQPAE